jgi:hypothetical protein
LAYISDSAQAAISLPAKSSRRLLKIETSDYSQPVIPSIHALMLVELERRILEHLRAMFHLRRDCVLLQTCPVG